MPRSFDGFDQSADLVKIQPGRRAKIMRPYLEFARGFGSALSVQSGAQQFIDDLLEGGFGMTADFPVDRIGDVGFESESGAHTAKIIRWHHDVKQ